MKRALLSSVLAFGALVAAMPAQASIQATWPALPPSSGPGNVPFNGLGPDSTLPPWGLPQPLDGSGPGSVIFNTTLTGPAGTYRLDYYGAEAAFQNEFRWNGALIFQHTGVGDTIIPPPTSPPPMAIAGPVFVNHAGGLLPFSFRINGNPLNELFNGANNPAVVGTPDFAITTDPNVPQASMMQTSRTSHIWHLFLDDGNPIDDDHDDMWVSISVPTPAAVLLFGAGLLGLGLVRRRGPQA